ncbi:MAG: RNA-binding protein [Geopsychrobacter sp.]|nr:RNA-binding protein [Geopsychrobacter sp.]
MRNKSKIRDIYVADISFDVVEEDLHKLFSVCGTVRAINMMNDERSGNFNGRAFIRMSTDAQAKEAVNMLDGTRLLNRCIHVSSARDKPLVAEQPEEKDKKPAKRRRPPKRTRK